MITYDKNEVEPVKFTVRVETDVAIYDFVCDGIQKFIDKMISIVDTHEQINYVKVHRKNYIEPITKK